MGFLRTIVLLLISTLTVSAKTIELTSVNEVKPFGLSIYCTLEGKGAFVQYKGQNGFIPLRITKFVSSVLTNSNTQPAGYYYVWDEVMNGNVTGTYKIIEHSGQVTDAFYLRKKDGRKFKLVASNKTTSFNNTQKYLLHNVLITFTWISTDTQFKFTYPDGYVSTPDLISLDAPDVNRSCYIKDYNFDGYDDLAFSLPDAGMGVYQTFNIWLYNPATKRFQALAEPDEARAKCSCLCNVTLNPNKKLLYTSCRGGARWWQDVYRIDKSNKLVWLRSGKETM